MNIAIYIYTCNYSLIDGCIMQDAWAQIHEHSKNMPIVIFILRRLHMHQKHPHAPCDFHLINNQGKIKRKKMAHI